MLRAVDLQAPFGLRGALDLTCSGSTAILGPNGAGKSTLIRLLAGLAPPQAGRVLLDDRDVHLMPPKTRARAIAYVPQNARLPVGFTVEAIVQQGRFAHGNDPEDAVSKALEEADLLALRRRRVETLSGGEAQRVLLARAFAQRADWLLLDEPFAHLDLAQRQVVSAVIARASAPVIAVLHDLNLAQAFDHWVLMKAGRIVAAGARQTVATAKQLSAVYGVPIAVWDGPAGPIVAPVSALERAR